MAAPKLPANQKLEQEVVRLTNLERKKLRLVPCRTVKQLTVAARGHSTDMLRLNFFDHVSPIAERESVNLRASQAGWTGERLSENIFEADGLSIDKLPAAVMSGWMNSPSHRDNLLDPDSDLIGVGVASKGKRFLVTQMFSSSKQD